jgi:FMN reductase
MDNHPERPQVFPMSQEKLHVLAVAGSLNKNSVTSVVIEHTAELLRGRGCSVDILDLRKEPLPLFNPEETYQAQHYPALQRRVEDASVYLLGTPDYHGSISSALKNFLDHFWQEFAGKLFATIVSSHEKGLTVTDQIRTVARQCYAWTMPYGVSFTEKEDLRDRQVASESLGKRLEMLARDAVVYGRLLTAQRQRDLAGNDPGFLARYRKAKPS